MGSAAMERDRPRFPQRAWTTARFHASARSTRPTAAGPRATACRSTGTRRSRTRRLPHGRNMRSSTGSICSSNTRSFSKSGERRSIRAGGQPHRHRLTPSWVLPASGTAALMNEQVRLDRARQHDGRAVPHRGARAGGHADDTEHPCARTRCADGVGAYYENTLQWTDSFRSIAGVREDSTGARGQRQPREFRDDERAHHLAQAQISSSARSTGQNTSSTTARLSQQRRARHDHHRRSATGIPPTMVRRCVRRERGDRRAHGNRPAPAILALAWRLELDSELRVQRRRGTTEASRPSLRRGIYWSNRYIPYNWLARRLRPSASRAQFRDRIRVEITFRARSTGWRHWG